MERRGDRSNGERRRNRTDWPSTAVIVGAEILRCDGSRDTRDRVTMCSWPRSWVPNPPT